jgi:hypothetical protein
MWIRPAQLPPWCPLLLVMVTGCRARLLDRGAEEPGMGGGSGPVGARDGSVAPTVPPGPPGGSTGAPMPPPPGGSTGTPVPSGPPGGSPGTVPPDRPPASATDGGAGPVECTPWVPPACDTAPPDPGARRSWRNGGSALLVAGGARHRGRDQLLPPAVPQWLIARFAYGLFDAQLVDEEVDIYLLRGCGSTWEKLGSARTTRANQHPTVEGVEDRGGHVYWEIPTAQALAVGRHRARFVVAGDLSTADLFIEVLAPATPFFVSDIDGTLTTSETAETSALLSGALPEANPDAATVLTLLAAKGYRPFYLTARPDWLVARTREFLSTEGFPPGILHTTVGAFAGATGAPAAMYKTAELATLAARGLTPAFLIGNTDTDAEAYASTPAPPQNRLFYRFTDADHMGRRFESYTALLPELTPLPPRCP